MKIRDICLIAVLGVTLYASQVAMAFLPNVEIVSLLVIIFTLVLGKRIIGVLAVFVLIEGVTYGFGTWWLMYLYIWPLLALAAYLLRRMQGTVSWALLSGVFGLLFGFLCSFVYFAIGGIGGGISYFIAGIPFDIIHCVSNFLLTMLLFKKLRGVLDKLYTKMQRM